MNEPDWAEQARQNRERKDRIALVNRTALFETLTACGLSLVTVEFNGSGDEGQIETVTFFRDGEEIPDPGATCELVRDKGTNNEQTLEPVTMNIAIEEVAYDLLYDNHEGWQDGEGAYGDFNFDVANRTVSLSINVRFVDSQNYQTTF
ncbi:DUF6878 family protein [Asticcacaulis taihuensis]|uniref:DUF6878 family protein n=1 Tax=Asticcacaulis taihuensis TaxID=260084 RepID=UPI0026F1BF60|nr:DUF6878 family protein [Asticcacaulis taihuensis]